MRARFIGDPKRNGEGPEVIEAFGLIFAKRAWVGVDSLDPALLRKLRGNDHFETDDAKADGAEPIPANWREAHWKTRMKWARDLGASPTSTVEADAAIEASMAPPVVVVPPVAPAKAKPVKSIADEPAAPGKDDDWGDLDP